MIKSHINRQTDINVLCMHFPVLLNFLPVTDLVAVTTFFMTFFVLFCVFSQQSQTHKADLSQGAVFAVV